MKALSAVALLSVVAFTQAISVPELAALPQVNDQLGYELNVAFKIAKFILWDDKTEFNNLVMQKTLENVAMRDAGLFVPETEAPASMTEALMANRPNKVAGVVGTYLLHWLGPMLVGFTYALTYEAYLGNISTLQLGNIELSTITQTARDTAIQQITAF